MKETALKKKCKNWDQDGAKTFDSKTMEDLSSTMHRYIKAVTQEGNEMLQVNFKCILEDCNLPKWQSNTGESAKAINKLKISLT